MNEMLDKTLGHEIELEADYEITKDVMVAAGFSYMTGTDLMKRLKRTSADGNLRWAWITLNITPTIFSSSTATNEVLGFRLRYFAIPSHESSLSFSPFPHLIHRSYAAS